jgi:serine/threonine protein kinase
MKNTEITEEYEISSKVLGKGSFGTVYKGTHKITQQERAFKIISKN